MNLASETWAWFTDSANWSGADGIPNRFVEHVEISAISIVVAMLVALPIGLSLGHLRRGSFVAINVSNVGRALPSLGILLFAVLAFGIGEPNALFRAIGIGSVPAFIVLVALGIPPMLTNAYVGVSTVDDEIVEASRGLGMRGRQTLARVEIPLAAPLVIAGIRTSAVGIVATATIAAYVGWGGLGRFIIDGYRVQDYPQMVGGAILVALLALAVELVFAGAQKFALGHALRQHGKSDQMSNELALRTIDAGTPVPVPEGEGKSL